MVIAPGNRLFGYIYLFGEKDFQESFNWACSLSGRQDCQWPKAIRTLSLFTLATCQMTEPTWQSLETEKWRKELILLGDQNRRLLKRGGGWTGRGALMSLKMFLNITRIQRLPKILQSTSRLSQSPGNCADKGTSCPAQFSGARYWASKRRETTSISCKTAEQ